MLTSIEIRNQEFDTKMRGYDRDQVDQLIKEAADTVESLTKENKEIQDELDWAVKRLDNYEEMQDSLNKSIIVAQEAADQLKENSSREANMILTDAKNQADLMIKEALSEVKRINQETEELRKHSRSFKQRLQIMVESQLELIESQNWDEVLEDSKYDFTDYQSYAESAGKNYPSLEELEAQAREETEEQHEDADTEVDENVSSQEDSNIGQSDDLNQTGFSLENHDFAGKDLTETDEGKESSSDFKVDNRDQESNTGGSFEYLSDPYGSQLQLDDEDGPVIDFPEEEH